MAGKGTKTISRIPRAMHRLNRQCRRSRFDFDVRIHSIKPNESIKGTASVNINGAFAIRGAQDY